MITVGIDMGSKTVKVLVLEDGNAIGKSTIEMELDRLKSSKAGFKTALDDAGKSEKEVDKTIATGIGRKVVDWANKGSTVVGCDARGMVELNPSVKMVVDIGANEARAIKCDQTGKVVDFAINEKCAAGSGAFVEAMARAMQVSLEEFSNLSFKSKNIP